MIVGGYNRIRDPDLEQSLEQAGVSLCEAVDYITGKILLSQASPALQKFVQNNNSEFFKQEMERVELPFQQQMPLAS